MCTLKYESSAPCTEMDHPFLRVPNSLPWNHKALGETLVDHFPKFKEQCLQKAEIMIISVKITNKIPSLN